MPLARSLERYDYLSDAYNTYIDSEPNINYYDMEKILGEFLNYSSLAKNPYTQALAFNKLFQLYLENLNLNESVLFHLNYEFWQLEIERLIYRHHIIQVGH